MRVSRLRRPIPYEISGLDLLRRLFGESVALGWLGSQNALTWMVFVSRLLPFASFDLVSYGAGLTLIKPWRFALATLLGLIPASFLLAHFGGKMAGANMNKTMTALLLIGLLVAVPLAFRLVRAHNSRDRETGNSRSRRPSVLRLDPAPDRLPDTRRNDNGERKHDAP